MIANKNINRIIIGLVVIAVILTGIFITNPEILGLEAQDAFSEYAEKLFPEDEIITIDIAADSEQWNEMLENATAEEYISCDLTINGETFYSVGIRPKGNSSLSMVANDEDTNRFSFKIKMDNYVDGQNYYGLSEFVVNNMQGDATYMKEYLSYDMFKTLGVSTPLYAFADISLNGEDWGFYLAIESMEEEYAQRNFGLDYGNLYKPESMGMGAGAGKAGEEMFAQGRPENTSGGAMNPEGERPARPDDVSRGAINFGGQPPNEQERVSGGAISSGGGNPGGGMNGGFGGFDTGGGADLIYTDDESESYSTIFDNASFKIGKSDEKRVINALKALSTGEDLEQYVDVDEALRYFAVNTTLVNLDSYISSMKHNYYLYEEDGKISILPWDLNLSFAGFQGGDSTSSVNFPIDTPVSGVELSDRPLIGNLLENEEYQKLYHTYLQKIVDEYFNSGYFEETIDKLNTLISEHVKADASAFYTYDQYNAAVETLKEFGRLRAQSIQGQLDGTVPSTSEDQASKPDQLIDASSINLSTMGSQGNGGDIDKGGAFRGRPQSQ